MEKKYQIWNNALAWFVFAIAAFVYLATVEPTASYWDCGEFIAAAFKLQVGHPPGAPLFLMIGRLFTLPVPPNLAALMINSLSALCSAFSILFLFWSITALAKKIALNQSKKLTNNTIITILGSGLIGALAYTFSDSFWFSAVEGEVYAMSSLFTAAVFWLMLKWEARADQPDHTRWLILIAYIMGLSIGVHLLNLLTIPALGFIYYFKKFQPSLKGFLLTGIISIVILGFIQVGIIPGTYRLASYLELLLVNSFGMPFHSGLFAFVILLFIAFIWLIQYTHRQQKHLLNTCLLALAFIIIGYSSYAMILIRANANPPMDENGVDNVFSLISYLNREQYGENHLLTGPFFDSPQDAKTPYVETNPVYTPNKKTGKYEITDYNRKRVYDPKFTTFFPRMSSDRRDHVQNYKTWSDFKGKPVSYTDPNTGQNRIIMKPTFLENLTFFINYQLNFMYFRYFFWNFAGKQNDKQGFGDIKNGNWLTGIKWIDAIRLGNQDKLPISQTSNKGYNVFFALPFLLGLLGLFFHIKKQKKDAWIVALLFFFTGIAIVLYVNNYAYQPRERDYSYAGSFYAFAIWIGLGVYALVDFIQQKIKASLLIPSLVTLFCLVVPGIMAQQGWDDHNRSNRYVARDIARAYLAACAPNAILFTAGDNDTFPLWYVQDVEGFRTDVRIVNLSLANTDWHIEQVRRKSYDSDALPISLPPAKYVQGTNDYLFLIDKNIPGYVDIRNVVDFVKQDDPATKIGIMGNKKVDYVPTKKFRLTVDAAKVLANGTVDKKFEKIIQDITWEINRDYITKADLLILDILATNNWERPIYFASSMPTEHYLGLENNFQEEGLSYRLVPYQLPQEERGIGFLNTDIAYDNLMNKLFWGGLDQHEVYLDETVYRDFGIKYRMMFAKVAEKLADENKLDQAKKLLFHYLTSSQEKNVPYDRMMIPMVELLYRLNETEKANEIASKIRTYYVSELDYALSLSKDFQANIRNDISEALYVLQALTSLTAKMYPQEFGPAIEKQFEFYVQQFN